MPGGDQWDPQPMCYKRTNLADVTWASDVEDVRTKLSHRSLDFYQIPPEVQVEVVSSVQTNLGPTSRKLHALHRAVALHIRSEAAVDVEQGKLMQLCEGFEVAHGIRDSVDFVVSTWKKRHAQLPHHASFCPKRNCICCLRRT